MFRNLTKIDLCSKALLKIGCQPISSFEENTLESIVSSQLYDLVKRSELGAYKWGFATKVQELNLLNTVPLKGYKFVFQMPSDCLSLLMVKSSYSGGSLDYKILSDEIYTNSEVVFITYIFDVDEKDFPPYFQTLLVSRLASNFIMPIMEDVQKYTLFTKESEGLFVQAKSLDTMQKPIKSIKSFSLTSVRV